MQLGCKFRLVSFDDYDTGEISGGADADVGDRSSYNKESVFPGLLNDVMALPLFDGGNVGVRRRELEAIISRDGYEPWASMYGTQ